MSDSTGADERYTSAIYRGFVRHRRFRPVLHQFRYPLFMVYIKLAELPELTDRLWLFGTRAWHWARFRREDYLGDPGVPLATAVKQRIAEKLGLNAQDLDGEVHFFGHLRYLGFYFSPLNLYFVERRGQMRYMLAEVSNTPWNERHYYAIDLEATRAAETTASAEAPGTACAIRGQDIHDKQFHVSPFNPMEQRYRWQVNPPAKQAAKSSVHLQVVPDGTDEAVFDVTMVLKRQPLNQSNLLRVLVTTPSQTLRMVAGIYWQALKLFLKGAPLYAHPAKQRQSLKAPR